MGANPWWYTVDYQSDIKKALMELREREFKAGRYYPVMERIKFPIKETSPTPGPKHKTQWEPLHCEDAYDIGTRSILDMLKVSKRPGLCAVGELPPMKRKRIFGTKTPTTETVEANLSSLFEEIERIHGVYVVTYKNDEPDKIAFAGMSLD